MMRAKRNCPLAVCAACAVFLCTLAATQAPAQTIGSPRNGAESYWSQSAAPPAVVGASDWQRRGSISWESADWQSELCTSGDCPQGIASAGEEHADYGSDSPVFGCADGGCSHCDCTACGCMSCEPWVVSREALFPDTCWNLDRVADLLSVERGCFTFPVTGGAWHWWQKNLIGSGSGYGIPGLRNTYFWYLYFDPAYDAGWGRKYGAHVELRMRETNTFRTFIDQKTWPWEAYAYVQDDEWGTLKGGLVYKQFGLFWDGVFFGNAPYFDGFKLDADYGLSWEKTTEIDDCLKVDSYVQFFFHEDQSNGSFAGADAESVVDYTEQNIGVARLVPTWTRSDGSVVALGFSGLVGQIDSRTALLNDQTIGGYGVDLTYTRGPWKLFAEGMQHFGVMNPTRYVSGGPSNRITNFLGGVHYTRGPVTYRCSYSNSLDANPDGHQNMVVAGMTVTVTENVDLYLEYIHERIDGNAVPAADGEVFNAIAFILNWHF